MNIKIDENEAAIFVMSITSLTVANMNFIVAVATSLIGLGIQWYFKAQQNIREQERHEWERKQNRFK